MNTSKKAFEQALMDWVEPAQAIMPPTTEFDLSICLFIHAYSYLSIYLIAYLSIYLSICLKLQSRSIPSAHGGASAHASISWSGDSTSHGTTIFHRRITVQIPWSDYEWTLIFCDFFNLLIVMWFISFKSFHVINNKLFLFK